MLLLAKKLRGLIFFLLLIQSFQLFGKNEVIDKKVTLNTREYENYRRFIVEIPESATNRENTFVRPEINSVADSGLFTITIKSENIQTYEGERLRKSEGEIPVRFLISYPDSNTIEIQGKTIGFDDITSYYLIDENKYIFDIYKFSNDDNFYSNSVQLLTSKEQSEKTSDTIVKSVGSIIEKRKPIIDSKKSSNNAKILSQSIKTAGMILSGIIFLIMATFFILKVYTGRSLFQDIKQLSHPSTKEPKTKKVSKSVTQVEKQKIMEDSFEEEPDLPSIKRGFIERPVIDESAINSMLFDKKERQIRKLMHQKNLNYNEAEMIFNLSHGQIHG